MIKINLTPIDELESQFWWVPDVAVAVVVAVVGYMGVQYYLGQTQVDIEAVVAKTTELNENEAKLAQDLQRYDGMEKDETTLKQKVTALQSITVSKISKYKPVITLEHFQNLKPEGVWYTTLKVGDSGRDEFELKGQAFDNLLVAEFLTALRSTASAEGDESDLRTLVHFDKIELEETAIKGGQGFFPELREFPEFIIRGSFVERQKVAVAPGGMASPAPGGPGAKPPPPGAPAAIPAKADPDDAPPPPSNKPDGEAQTVSAAEKKPDARGM